MMTMAIWKCVNCLSDNSDKNNTCNKCGTVRIEGEDLKLFFELKSELQNITAEIESYKISKATKWEYLEVTNEDVMNYGNLEGLGKHGWELVTAISINVTKGGALSAVYKSVLVYTFKRPYSELTDELKSKIKGYLDRIPAHLEKPLHAQVLLPFLK
jgi:hypothetical protein